MRPTAMPIPTATGMITAGLPSPCGISTPTITMLTKFSSGPIEMSIPPPPERICGVEAIAASANGANVANVAGQELGVAKLERAISFATTRRSARAVANPHGRSRTQRDTLVTGRFISSEERRCERGAREPFPRELPEHRLLAEHKNPVHQLDVLV